MTLRNFALTAIAAAAAVTLVAGSAHAAAPAPLTALQTLQQFNLVTLGNAATSNHVDGRSWVGGSFTGNGATYAMHPQDMAASDYAGLTVMGAGVASNATAVSGVTVIDKGMVAFGNSNNVSVNNGNTAIYGNSTNTSFNGSGSYYVSGTVSGGNRNVTKLTTVAANSVQALNTAAASSTNFSTVLGGLSTSLKGLAATTKDNVTSHVDIVGNKATFTAAVVNGVAVFDLTHIDDQLFSHGLEFDFKLGAATSVIFNSDVTSANLNDNFLGGAANNLGSKMIWNFYNASSLTVSSQFGGSILATGAALTVNQNVEGGVYVQSLAAQTGEIHLKAFSGALPAAAVPEPETYAMLLAGLGLVGFMARRRKAAAAN